MQRGLRQEGGFFKYVSIKRKSNENVCPLLNEVDSQVRGHSENAELLNTFFFCFGLYYKVYLSEIPVVRERVWRKEDFNLVDKELVKYCLSNINTHKCMGTKGFHSQVLRVDRNDCQTTLLSS